MELDATNGFPEVNAVNPHSVSHVLGKTSGTANSNKCTVCAIAPAHHGRDKAVHQLPNLRAPRSEGDAWWEYKSLK